MAEVSRIETAAPEVQPPPPSGGSSLAAHHRARLSRAIPAAWLEARGPYTVTDSIGLVQIGASKAQRCLADNGPVLAYPVHCPSGREAVALRPDFARVVTDAKGKQSQPRWESPAGELPWLDVGPRCQRHIGDASVPLVITEGPLKADVAGSLFESSGIAVLAVGLQGVWNFKPPSLKPEWDAIAIRGREAFVLFDSDVVVNADVLAAARGVASFLKARGARFVRYFVLPEGDDGGKVDIEDYVASGGTYSELETYLRDDPVPVLSEIQWRVPTEPDHEIVNPGPFPLDVLPPLNAVVAEALAQSRGALPDLGAAPQLVLAGAAAQGAFEIRITESFRSPTGLMMIVSAPPNAGKGTIDHIRTPAARWEQAEKRKAESRGLEDVVKAKLGAIRLKGLEKSLRDSPDDSAAIERFENELRELERLSQGNGGLREFLIDNVTMEAWGLCLDTNFGCWTMIDSEGGGLVDLLAGRYSANVPDVDILLRSFRGEPYKVNRIGRPGIDVASVRGSLCVAIQPIVAERWFDNEWLALRGVLNRLMFISIPPRRQARLVVPEAYADPGLMALFDDQVRVLLSLAEDVDVGEDGQPVRQVFRFTDEGLAEISAFGASLSDRAGEFGDLHVHIGFLERLIPDVVCRLAVSIHLLHWAHGVIARRYQDALLGDEPEAPDLLVPEERVRDALRVAFWAIEHRQSLVARLEADWVGAGLRRLRRLLLRRADLLVEERDLLQNLKGPRSLIRTRLDLDRLLREAIRLGWVARVATDSGRRELAVNPKLFTGLDLPEGYEVPSVVELATGEGAA